MSRRELIAFERAEIRRMPGGEPAIPDLTWTIGQGEAWALTGPTGSGKTTHGETLAGRHRVAAGLARWPIADGHPSPSAVVSFVGFREESRAFSYAGKYYQQRYEFVAGDDEQPATLASYLGESADDVLLDRFGLASLKDRLFVTLSNGQTRKARIIKALANRPRLLVLDDPYVGLDAAAKTDLDDTLHRQFRSGMNLVLIARPGDVPGWIDRRLSLGNPPCGDADPHDPGIPRDGPNPGGDVVVELDRVSIRHGSTTLLSDLSWTVRRGERWAIVGRNGSGKTTLISLLCGDHPQAFSQRVSLFGQRRGSGESIWDVKRRVGLVSPELHLYFSEPLTVRQTIASGFTETLVAPLTTDDQQAAMNAIAGDLKLSAMLDRPFRQLSSGEQRLTLIARSLVKQPELIVWDEPFQCLDDASIRRVMRLLDRQVTNSQTILFVTHDPTELPGGFTTTLRLA